MYICIYLLIFWNLRQFNGITCYKPTKCQLNNGSYISKIRMSDEMEGEYESIFRNFFPGKCFIWASGRQDWSFTPSEVLSRLRVSGGVFDFGILSLSVQLNCCFYQSWQHGKAWFCGVPEFTMPYAKVAKARLGERERALTLKRAKKWRSKSSPHTLQIH